MSRDPDWLVDQYKAGYKASGAVRRFDVPILPDLLAHLNSMRQWESLDLEAALADAFCSAGIGWSRAGVEGIKFPSPAHGTNPPG